MKFNPVRFLKRSPDGSLELPLFARLLWLSSECPGWRVTSEKVVVLGLDVPDGKETTTRYVAVGHVAIIDDQGRKVISVPSSVEVESPDFAEEIYRNGASLALDAIGFHVRNIPEEYWKAIEEPELPEGRKQERRIAGKQPDVEKIKKIIEEPHEDEFEESPETDTDTEFQETFSMFKKALEKNPSAIGISPKDKGLDELVLFNKYCYKICGLPWDSALPEEKGRVKECLKELL